MSDKNFTHLHVHTEYSLLDGASRITELVNRAKELGMDSIAITDHGVMYGVVEFYKQAKKAGIKPILGFEAYIAKRSMYDKDPQKDKSQYHLVLLAENEEGYKNIIKICSEGFVNGFYYKPRVDYDVLRKYSKGVIALSACLGGEVQSYLLDNDYEKATEKALMYREIFGENNFFLELQDHGMDEQKKVNRDLCKLSRETGIKLVCTNDVHYINKSDAKFHDVLLCIQTQKTINEDRMKFPSDEFYLKSYDEMSILFPEEALINSYEIVKRCNVELDFDTVHLPEFPIPEGYTRDEYFNELCQTGLAERYPVITKEIQDRLDYEMSVIKQMGYVDYFLIVWDFIKYAKDNKIMVGPGRGSGAGSLVAYSLKITNIDPLKYNLIFERFLNPERVSMPDIDVDFCYERREEVIDYVIRKYGEDRVAQIVTFGTLAARAAIKDVGRALDMSYQEVDFVAKKIPSDHGMNLTKAMELNKELKELYDTEPKIKNLIDVALKVEGLPRHTSTHAAGVLISKDAVTEYVPLSRSKDVITTQFNMTELEELGLLKMDFLGLRTLTVIRDTVAMVKKDYNIDIDFNNFTYDDPKVFEMFSRAETLGIFQFESRGMRNFLKELKPTVFENIAAANAMYRPGPMSQIPTYIKNRLNPESVTYLHPKLEHILNVTYGCMVYQEQVMQIVRDIGGFSMGRSDLLRRAMGKKKMKIMQEEREHFIYGMKDDDGNIVIPGAIRNGVDEKTANKIYDLMIDFAKYAFPKAHSVAYAVLAYETAYLKCYYPAQFMAALISSIMGSATTVSLYIKECRRLGIEVLPPDINESEDRFTVKDGKIRFGLAAVKNVGSNVIAEIVKTREKKGKFETFTDFCQKVDAMVLNKRQVESLIKCGAFDSLNVKRAQLIAVYEKTIDGILNEKRRNVDGQVSLFDTGAARDIYIGESLPDIKEFNLKAKLNLEKEMLGLYISGHPLSEYEDELEKKTTTNCSEIAELAENIESGENTSMLKDGSRVIMGGIIIKKQNKVTKNNNMMCFLTLEDLLGTIEVIIFPRVMDQYQKLLFEDNIVLIEGNLSIGDDDVPKLIGNKITTLVKEKKPEKPKRPPCKLYIKLDSKEMFKNSRCEIMSLLQTSYGHDEVIIYCEKEKAQTRVPKEFFVDCDNEEFFNKLLITFGKNNVIIKR